MARIRKLEIKNFRGIKTLSWRPSTGLNCLIGPGDSCKSSILDAIDLCIGARRTIQVSDADFHDLNVENAIAVSVTLGELDDALKNIDAYGAYVRGFNRETGDIEDEPEHGLETVLTVNLAVGSDLEPSWTLLSERAAAQELSRNLSWGDRVRLAPTRIGVMADYHLGWGRASVLNRISEERADASAALAKAAREARQSFGSNAQDQLGETLRIVGETAAELGIDVGGNIRAMLDVHSVSFSGGTIALHNDDGVPLRGLGTGSTRLLIAGLQRKAAPRSSVLLMDEAEHGLEPHRIIRLLHSLGSKESQPPLQVFMTTHSPVVLRELSGAQLFVVRASENSHDVSLVGTDNAVQGTIRLFPEAFLAPKVLVGEGASEVGLVRGLEQYSCEQCDESLFALGVTLLDSGGGDADRPFARASALAKLGYKTAVLRDADLAVSPGVEDAYRAAGGTVISWREGRALEDELFLSLSDDAVRQLVDRAIAIHGEELINEHIRSVSGGSKDLVAVQAEAAGVVTPETRTLLGKAAKRRHASWFKSVTLMEGVARDIVGPTMEQADTEFFARIRQIWDWANDGG
jgi:putative ATP-dependent endonuclease of OLD family